MSVGPRRWLGKSLVIAVGVLLRFIYRRKVPTSEAEVVDLLHSIAPLINRKLQNPNKEPGPELQPLLREMFLSSLPPNSRELIPSLALREAPVRNTWSYQNEVMQWDIPDDARVLDVGSGGWPFTRATELADKYPEATTHRVEDIVRDQRPFHEVDLEKLSFGDDSYDFIFCSHVLEHLDNPGAAMRELMRVGKRGYIEVPTRLSDVMFNFTRLRNHHRWHGLVVGKTVLLVEWNDWERQDLGNVYFNALQSEYANAFQEFFERNRMLFFASIHWDECFDFLVIDKQGKVIDSSTPRARNEV